MREVLKRAGSRLPLAIVSGRDLADARDRVDLPELVYAGSHGFDIAGPDGLRYEHPAGQRARPALEAAADAIEERLAQIPGHLVEPKAFALAVHYRQVPEEDHDAVEAAVREAAETHSELRLTGGKKVWELRPDVDWDKGRALLWLLETLDLDGPEVLPFYLGDDETDEDAFRALEGRGLGVLVADRPRATAADFRLADPGDVARFLERIEQWEDDRGE
jgi:alpha,alpha-trehalase